jgi:hypothetical protein
MIYLTTIDNNSYFIDSDNILWYYRIHDDLTFPCMLHITSEDIWYSSHNESKTIPRYRKHTDISFIVHENIKLCAINLGYDDAEYLVKKEIKNVILNKILDSI